MEVLPYTKSLGNLPLANRSTRVTPKTAVLPFLRVSVMSSSGPHLTQLVEDPWLPVPVTCPR